MNSDSIYFFTATILKWQKLLLDDSLKSVITNSFKFCVQEKRVWTYGFVIMPNHMHVLLRLRNVKSKSDFQRDLLKFTAQQFKFYLEKNSPATLQQYKATQSDRMYQFWERRAYWSTMNSRNVTEQKLDYIHANPVQGRWKLANSPDDYFFSSARFYLLNIDEWGFITHYMDHI